jgi:hypothetical protein
MALLTDTHAAALTALFPPLGLAVAIVMTYSPPLPDWALPVVADTVMEARPDPSYLQLDNPIRVGLKDGRVQLSLNLAFSARLPGVDLLTLSGEVKTKQKTLMAAITAEILARAETEDDTAKMLLMLRRDLPPAIRDLANKELATESIPEPVDQVFMLDVLAQGG